MLPLGIILGFTGYGLGSWGYILVKGYNITLREWFSPLHPFTGALDSNGCVPQGSIFPVVGKGGPCGTAAGPKGASAAQLNKEAAAAGRASPGSVAGRF